MAELYCSEDTPQRVYWDRKFYSSFLEQVAALNGSSTLYVGNLSFFTTELQIYEVFSRVGPIKRIIMGLNKDTKTPCGFCFVEYFTHAHAAACLKFISGTTCDDRIIRCELDAGFTPGRQYGRGASGGQIRDERRQINDPQRGGNINTNTNTTVLGKRGNDKYDRGHIIADDRMRNVRDNQSQRTESKSGETYETPATRTHDDDDEVVRKNPRFRNDNKEDDEGADS